MHPLGRLLGGAYGVWGTKYGGGAGAGGGYGADGRGAVGE